MSNLSLTPIRLRTGIWEAIIKGESDQSPPMIRVTLHDRPVETVDLTEDPEEGGWLLQVKVPAEAIADGVHTFLVRDASDDTKLGSFTLIAGDAAGEDLRAEVDLLRAEMDMIKRAFRRHCLETM
ncbi:hypothetical protein [Chachezhania sediminis]|uniref:hypothetical protein n=1 Tax=Chachezhania sediminis TaxID=2599291 RepID=UPI00131C134E|nr:hypothetical protein [Chachezhania sediminis]